MNEKESRAASPTYEDVPFRVVKKKQENASTLVPKLNKRTLGIGGIVFTCMLLAIFGGNYLIKNINSTEMDSPVAIKTKTPMPTKTFTSPASTFTPTPGEDGMLLMFVPEGEFTMGKGSGEHKVNLDAFWIDQTEVTNAMYAKCVINGGCKPPTSVNSSTHDRYYGNPEFDDFPVIYVDWNQANAYCTWAERRLPTEAEWEKAARGTDGITYPWGDDSPNSNILNYNGEIGDTTEVGKYQGGASVYGALDMAGNVWEWVSSLYQAYPYDATDGREDLTASGSRVLRGGSWYYLDFSVRSDNRYWFNPLGSNFLLGFRCSLPHP